MLTANRFSPWVGFLLLPWVAACDDPGNATFQVRESVEQLHVWHATPGEELVLRQGDEVVQSGIADEQGSFVFRRVPPGQDYRVHAPDEYTRALKVSSVEESLPPQAFYSGQKLVPGYQYLEMRDGTRLSAFVTLPGPVENGPYPTVVNYSGYAPSRPGRPVEGATLFCEDFPILCDAPNAESSLFAGLLGYATISVNIRGTGCSGGAYDYFETMQLLDGYDVIEIAAAQDWVLHHQVGMVGLSYPGITQLFVARQKPPGLAAITPLSVIGNTVTTLVPGGILNDGFAISWVTQVLDKAAPYAQGWEQERVDAGDVICEENQLLHSQRVDNVEQARNTPYYVPELIDPLNPELWVDEIEVPVFLSGAWQDEQTGPFFGVLLDRFERAPDLRVVVQNGVHIDGYAPAVFQEWKYFLDLFVARKTPSIPNEVRGFASILFTQLFDADLSLPPERFAEVSDYEEALTKWRTEPSIQVFFESGSGAKAGAPGGGVGQAFSAWPPPGQVSRRWFFQPDGSLGAEPPAAEDGASVFRHDEEAGSRGILSSGSVWARDPNYVWRYPAAEDAVVFETPPLEETLMMVGTGSVDLWLRSTATEADVEVNLTEIRPDGQEMYVQSGWLRTSKRQLGADSSELYPAPTYLEQDAEPLEPGRWVSARVAIAPFGHIFRAGSQIRISVDTPGDSRADWRFALAPVPDDTQISVAHSQTMPSSLALPVIEGVTVSAPLPACSVRGQQCRAAQTFQNTPAQP